MPIYKSEPNPRLFFWLTDDAGDAVTSATLGDLEIWVHRPGIADAVDPLSITLAADETSTSVGAIHHVSDGLWWVNVSTAHVSAYSGNIMIRGNYVGGKVTPDRMEVNAYDPTTSPNTIEPATLVNVTDARDTITALLPAALVGGRMDVSVGAMASNVRTKLDATQPDYAPAKAGDEMTLPTATLTALFSDADVADLMVLIAEKFDASDDLAVVTIAAATRDAILDRVLSSNHEVAGSVGKVLQYLDAAISSRLATLGYTAPDNAASQEAATQATAVNTKLTTERLTKIDGAMQAAGEGFTGETLSGQIDAIEGGGGSGTGANTVTITVTDGTGPLEGATVRLTSGIVTAVAVTDENGEAVLLFDDLTASVAITKSGYTIAAGTTLVVSGDTAETYAMTTNVVPLPAAPGTATGVMTLTLNGTPVPNIAVRAELIVGTTVAGTGQLTRVVTETSDANGTVQFTMCHGAQYKLWIGERTATAITVTVPAVESFNLPNLIGR